MVYDMEVLGVLIGVKEQTPFKVARDKIEEVQAISVFIGLLSLIWKPQRHLYAVCVFDFMSQCYEASPLVDEN